MKLKKSPQKSIFTKKITQKSNELKKTQQSKIKWIFYSKKY